MSTVAGVTDDRVPPLGADAGEQPDAGRQPSAPSQDIAAGAGAVQGDGGAAQRRSLLVPVLSTACAALIAGVLGLAVVGFNTLRDDIRFLDAKIDSRFGELDAKIDSQIGMLRDDMDERFGEVNAILLDHTERLARIETGLGVGPAAQP